MGGSVPDTPVRTAFLTFSCHQRQHWMVKNDVCAVIRDHLAADAMDGLVALHAWVIMANHLHLLVTDERMQLSVWVRRLKQATACRLRSECRESLPLSARHGPFWLKGGGHDRTIWSWQEYWAKVRYIHLNPVRAGLCRRAEDWEWSSASDSLRQPRAGSPTLSPPPEALVDLLWWTPTA